MSMSLGRRMLVSLVGVAAIGVAIDLVLWRVLDRRLRTEAIGHARSLATLLAGESAVILQQPVRDLDLAMSRLSGGEPVHTLERYLRGGSLVEQILVLDERHAVTAVLPHEPDLVGLDWSRQPFAAESGRAWSDTFLSPDRHEPGVMLHAPWAKGTIAFRISLAQLSELAAVVEPPPGGFVAIVDRRGVVIGHGDAAMARRRESLRDLALVATAGGGTAIWRGTEGLLTGAAIPDTGWTVLVFQPVTHVFATARQAALLPSVVLLAMLAVVAGIFLALRHQLARALRRFAAHMHGMAAGHAVVMGDHPDELRPLATSFVTMAEAVQQRTAELERSRAEFRALVEGVDAVILRLDPQGRIVYMNPAGERLFGWTSSEIAGRHVVGTILPEVDETGAAMAGLVDRALRDPQAMRRNQNENRTRDGRRLWMVWQNRAEFDAQGQITGLFCVGADLTEQNRQERAFQAVVEAMVAAGGDAVFDAITASLSHWLACDLVVVVQVVAGRVQPLAHRGLAMDPAIDLAGTPCAQAMQDGWLLVEDGLGGRFPGCPLVAGHGMRSFLGIAVPGGQAVVACMWRTPFVAPPRLQQVMELLARRIATELEGRELRVRLAHTERLESLGQLAGGVAHDFNNQLAVVLASAELLRPQVTAARALSLVDGIILAANRSADLTRQLLAFARRGSLERAPVDLHTVIRETVELVGRTIGRSVAISHELHATRSTVLGSAGLLQNALVNLAINARDAMPDGGTLVFRTVDDGARLVLTVTDTGCGMDAAVQARLFEPFFTTKPVGKGNGLGLAAVYGTVTGMGGTITVRSAVGAGTTFVITVDPIAGVADAPCAATPGRTARILVADDEAPLRDQVSQHLRSLGHLVTTAVDGQDAVEAVQAAPQGFDLVLLDGMMPRLTGWQAYVRMRAIAPGLRAVVLTGYGSASDIDGFRSAGVPVLVKPCPLDRLAAVVAQTLAGV
jgi:PAS domain S-box-containing protein